MVATATLDKIVNEGPATTDETIWVRGYFTRLADNSKDQFLSEVTKTDHGDIILSTLEADSGEEFV